MIVMKFGGTSVGSPERMAEVVRLVEAASAKHEGVLVVLSAMSGITNALIKGSELAVDGDLDGALAQVDLVEIKHLEAIECLFGQAQEGKAQVLELKASLKERLDDLRVLYKGIRYLGELSKRSLDAVSGMGELFSSQIVARLAEHRGLDCRWLDARHFLITDDNFGKANPLWVDLGQRIKEDVLPFVQKGKVVFTQGFIGATACGVTTTLGRGGSDYSAAIFGVALDAQEIQIWTDVDGMMTSDPRIIPGAQVLPEVSFQEASELAYFGAKVLHPMTIKPAVEKNIAVRILNTFKPDEPGTLIKDQVRAEGMVRAIASKKDISAIFISSPKMLMSHGFLAGVFAVFNKYKTSIDTIATSEISVALTVDDRQNLESIVAELCEFGEVRVEHDCAIVSVVGRNYRTQAGIAGRVFKALSHVNIVMISSGASEINLTFVVAGEDAGLAVRSLHAEFFDKVLV